VSYEEFTTATGNTCVRYEVQNPIRGFPKPPANPGVPVVPDPDLTAGNAYLGTAIIFEGVRDVYEKGPIRQP
jgi:hypothetical protein